MSLKLEDPGCFNTLVSINVAFIGEALCELGASINLMLLETFNQTGGLKMQPSEAMVKVVYISNISIL
jgi:hypothetical protein